MKTKNSIKLILLLFIIFFFSAGTSNAQIEIDTSGMAPPEEEPTLQDLKDSLSAIGNWDTITENEIDPEVVEGEDSTEIDDEDIYTNIIWIPSPTIIYIGWNPYSYGRWVWTCWGWQWIPYDNWGWCTYHYGRWWYSHRHHSWVWSPGRRWRHCWVSWYRRGNYWGWHPLPPRLHYRHGIAVIPRSNNVENDGWVFVDKKDFNKKVDKSTVLDAKKHTEIFSKSDQTLKQDEKKKQTFNPNTYQPETKKPDVKTTEPKKENKNNDLGTNKNKGNKEQKPEQKKESTNKNNNSTGNKNSSPPKSNDNGYSPPKTEYKQSPPPKTEYKQSPPPKTETKQSPPPKTETKQSPPQQKTDDSNPPPQKNNSGN
jgi:hypothetical protein